MVGNIESNSLGRKASSFLSVNTTLGIRPYTAKLRISLTGRRSASQFGRFTRGFLVTSNHDRLERLRVAMAWCKSARDQVFLDTEVFAPLTFGPRLFSPNLKLGSQVERN